jgi:hypothetical protein
MGTIAPEIQPDRRCVLVDFTGTPVAVPFAINRH